MKLPGNETLAAKTDEKPVVEKPDAKPADVKKDETQKENADKDESKSLSDKKPADKNAADKPESLKPYALDRIKCEGHIHRFLLNSPTTELYAAGHHKLEIWRLV